MAVENISSSSLDETVQSWDISGTEKTFCTPTMNDMDQNTNGGSLY